MASRVPIVRIPELTINPRNSLMQTQPVMDALESIQRGQQFSRQQGLREEEFAHRSGMDEARFGLEQDRFAHTRGQAQRSNAEAEEARIQQRIASIAATIDGIADDGARSQAWTRFVGSSPHIARALAQYGQDPNDHVNGPRFIVAQTVSPGTIVNDNISRRSRQPEETADPMAGYRVNEQGELERAPQTERGVAGSRLAQPAAFRVDRPTIGQRPQEQPIPTQAPSSGQPTGVPGITLNRPLSADRAAGESDREVDAAALLPRVRANDQTLTPGEINRFYTAYWGRQPRPGNIYNIRGQEVANAAESAGDRGTRDAIQGALAAAQYTIADARQIVRGTSWIGRQFSHATDIGDLARIMPDIELAATAIMHGLSGAQVNIPETQRYLRAFTPQPGDRLNTIERKLDHMEFVMASIRRRRDGQRWTEEDILALRNQMRGRLGLPALRMEQHRESGRGPGMTEPSEPEPMERTDQPRRRSPSSASGGGWRIERID